MAYLRLWNIFFEGNVEHSVITEFNSLKDKNSLKTSSYLARLVKKGIIKEFSFNDSRLMVM